MTKELTVRCETNQPKPDALMFKHAHDFLWDYAEQDGLKVKNIRVQTVEDDEYFIHTFTSEAA